VASAKVRGDRTCIGCRSKAPKRELARLVRDRRGAVVFSPTGNGRGAYVHRSAECVAKALRTEAFARSFRQRIFNDPHAAERLRAAIGIGSEVELEGQREA